MTKTQDALDGIDADVAKTALGFGGKTIDGILVIGDELYLLLKCEVSSDGRKEKGEDGELQYVAGCRTTILAELSLKQATQVAADHG